MTVLTVDHEGLHRVTRGATSTATSFSPSSAEMIDAYSAARRLQQAQHVAPDVDWEIEAAIWADDAQEWAESVRGAASEAIDTE